jgi:hypothetical protein
MTDAVDIDLFATSVYRVISDYYDITLYRPSKQQVIFWGNPILRKRGWRRELNRRLASIRARAKVDRDRERYRITITPLSKSPGWPPLLNTLLFILTFLTVLIAASYRESGAAVFPNPRLLATGLPFTLTLLFILLVHEMGHFLTGNRRAVIMSYPYFIPAPTFLGTFGALIRSRTPIRSRNDLILIGAAGPLAGAVPALIALIWGFTASRVVPMPDEPILIWGNSLITWLLQLAFFGDIPSGMILDYSSVALAGHVGLLVTMINLLPLGQLDGGHIIYGLFEKRQHLLAAVFLLFLFGLGFLWSGWWIWMILAFFIRPFHPPIIERNIPLDDRAKKIGWAAVILFVVSFVPMPIH